MQKSGFLRALQASLLALSLVAINLAPLTSVLAQTTDTPPPSNTEVVDTKVVEIPTPPVVDNEGEEDTDDGTEVTDPVVDDEIDSKGDADLGDDVIELMESLFMGLSIVIPDVQVHIYKYISGPSGEALATGATSFPMQSSWSADNIGTGSGSYSLSSPTFSADTSPMTSGADYATNEVTGGDVLPAGAECQAGKFRLVGYREGTSLEAAQSDSISTVSPSYTDLTSDMYVIVVNESCDNLPTPPPTTPVCNLGDDTTFDTFTLGSINGQIGWSSTGPFDQEIVENTYGYSTFGCKSLRISNAVASGSFGDQTFSYSVANEAGETDALNGGMSGGTRQNHFEAEFDLGTTMAAVQPGMVLSVAPDRGDGARMSYLRFEDQADGIHVFFDDVQGTSSSANFVETDIATLDRDEAHSIMFSMDFVEGHSNDIVEIYIDGVLEHTGTSWENYYRFDPESNPSLVSNSRTVDSLLFRVAGTAVPANDENGFLFDNVSLASSNEAPQMCTLVSDAVNTYVGFVPATETFEHNAWSDELDADGAKWIWNSAFVTDPTQPETVTFTRTFTSSAAGTATLQMASDNVHTVTVNGLPVSCGGATEPNYASVGGDNTCTFPVVSGENDISFTVTNHATPSDSNPENNPAGLYYKITVPNSTCGEVPPVNECVINGDETTVENDEPSFIAEFIHSSWTAIIDGAEWIWGDEAIVDPVGTETQVFTKTFTLDSAPVTDATLEIAADNSYSVTVNGVSVGGDPGEVNYTDEGKDSITIPASAFQAGMNTLDITVTNFLMGGGTQETNPAGLKYKLTVNGSDCTENTQDQSFKVKVFKYLMDEGTASQVPNDAVEVPLFSMKAVYDIEGVGTNLDPGDDYQLGNGGGVGSSDDDLLYAANTIPLGSGDTYGTHEVTGGDSPVVSDAEMCEAGKYLHLGYKTGDSLAAAQAAEISQTAPYYVGFSHDKYVIVVNQDCDELVEEPETLKVHILKYQKSGQTESLVADNSGAPAFPMRSSWDATNIGAGSGSYVLGNNHGGNPNVYGADTSPMSAPADYTTYEVTTSDNDENTVNDPESPVITIGGQCVVNKYRLVGYRAGATLGEAQTATLTTAAPVFTDITSDRYILVVNEDCDDVLDENPGEGDPETQTITVSGNTSAGENLPGWMFNRDPSTQSPYGFVAGVASIGTGSLFVEPITNTINGNFDKFIGELFLLLPLSDINSISYDFRIDAPDATAEEQFYMTVYTNFGESPVTKFYDCRYNVVPTVGIVGGFTTVTFDPTLTYDVTTRGTSPHPCPASPSGMDALDAGSPSIRAISLNVGDTSGSDTGVSGYYDKVVVSTDSMITTYDFEPVAQQLVPEVTNNTSSGGNGSRSSRSNSLGQVLGASTDGQVLGNSCPLLTLYMREGLPNDSSQISALQTFLNGEMSLSLAVSGIFDVLTTNAVNAFQVKYASEVLAPWVPYGLTGGSTPTGYVYKTTLWKINDIACPDLDAPFPTLP